MGRPKKPTSLHYKVVCISMYTTDLAALEASVDELKRRGLTRANKSWLIRQALAQLDLSKLQPGSDGGCVARSAASSASDPTDADVLTTCRPKAPLPAIAE